MNKLLRNRSGMLNVFFLVLILVSAPYLKRFTLAEKAAVSQSMAGDLEARNKNAFALILGEIRATAADLMFIKTERYLHSGVASRQPTGSDCRHGNEQRREPPRRSQS
jgi:hypothetical protein